MKDTNKIIIANWKMNPQTKKDAEKLFKETSLMLKKVKRTDVVVCVPFPFLYIKEKSKNTKIKLGSQDMFFEKEGSYTGEISPLMLKNFSADYVIIGHSERRKLGETNENINKKIIAALKTKITPIFCIGEKDRDNNGFYLSFIKQQISEGLSGLTKAQIKNIIIAYEPVWAIGSGATREATPSEFNEIRIFIKKVLSDLFDIKTANELKIIYGGSVNPLNALSFLKEGDAYGLLVGRDSLSVKKFGSIINLAENN